MHVECFAQRLLNPFRGAMHTIKYQAAEAVTLDGVHWDIYVANDQLLAGLNGGRHAQISDIRYGSWSPEKGLKRGPLYPSEDFRRMEEMGAVVYEHLTQMHEQVPFPFKDRFELWLLDTNHQPLALLHSVVEERQADLDLSIEWRAGYTAREQFTSPATRQLAESMQPSDTASDYLARYINARAGDRPAAQWFRRVPDGTGVGLQGIKLAKDLVGRTLASPAFPPLFLADSGHDAAHRCLIDDFHAWQAPWLLVLPSLDRPTRDALERRARQQVFLVETQYRLYPEFVDESAIQATLVEAMLRRSQPLPQKNKDDTMSTFYIELSPDPTE
jgi:hypothetical protein